MSQLLHDNNDNDNAKAIAIPQVFSENSRPQNSPYMLEGACQ